MGSLHKAAIHLDYSYRYAWGVIKKMETLLGYDLLLSKKGGHVKQLKNGTLSYGFGFQFRHDANGKLLRIFKDGVNAGVAAMAAFIPNRISQVSYLPIRTAIYENCITKSDYVCNYNEGWKCRILVDEQLTCWRFHTMLFLKEVTMKFVYLLLLIFCIFFNAQARIVYKLIDGNGKFVSDISYVVERGQELQTIPNQ